MNIQSDRFRYGFSYRFVFEVTFFSYFFFSASLLPLSLAFAKCDVGISIGSILS